MNKKRKLPNPAKLSDEALLRQLFPLIKELESRAERKGGDMACARWVLQKEAMEEMVANLCRLAKDGDLRPYGTSVIELLLWMADTSISQLLWQSESRPDDLKPFARGRCGWPAYVTLSKRMQDDFQRLLGTFNQQGRRIERGPIELGADLPFEVNRKTEGDILFIVARDILERVCVEGVCCDVLDFAPFIARLGRFGDVAWREPVIQFQKSLGPFTRANWEMWKPLIKHCLDLHHGPAELRWSLIPEGWRTQDVAVHHFCAKEWLTDHARKEHLGQDATSALLKRLRAREDHWKRYVEPPLSEQKDLPLFHRITRRAKADPASEWSELRDEVLKKIHNFARKM